MTSELLRNRSYEVMGRTLHYLERRGSHSASPTLVLLHGFPECAEAWLPVLAALPEDMTVIMPDLPGFGDSDALLHEQDYQVEALIKRLAAFIGGISSQAIHLVGHDWGGALAWPLAAFYPTCVQTLTIINAAHPGSFVRELKYNPKQREKSIYINTLNKPGAADILAARDFRLLKRIMGESLVLSGEPYAQRLEENWSNTDRLNAMLGYYRNMPQGVPTSDAEAALLQVPELRVTVPVKVLWGCQDEAFDEAVLDGLEKWVSNLTVCKNRLATHWLHREQPEWVAQHIVAHAK